MQIKLLLRKYLFEREKKFFSRNFKKILKGQEITLVDVGAAGDIETRWKRISDHIKYIGFEPDTRSFSELKQQSSDYHAHIIHSEMVWSKKGTLQFNLCRGWQQSSHYIPNYDFVDKFPDEKRFEIEQRLEIQTETIDNVIKDKVDFIKIDTQGGELEILTGAKGCLKSALGLEVELGFAEIYKDQPLHNDVIKYIENCDFVFIDFTVLRRWERHDLNTTFGQLVFADGLFLRNPEYILSNFYDDQFLLAKYIAVACLYNRHDLVDVVLRAIKQDNDTLNAIKSLRRRFKRFTRLRKCCDIGARLVGSEFYLYGKY